MTLIFKKFSASEEVKSSNSGAIFHSHLALSFTFEFWASRGGARTQEIKITHVAPPKVSLKNYTFWAWFCTPGYAVKTYRSAAKLHSDCSAHTGAAERRIMLVRSRTDAQSNEIIILCHDLLLLHLTRGTTCKCAHIYVPYDCASYQREES